MNYTLAIFKQFSFFYLGHCEIDILILVDDSTKPRFAEDFKYISQMIPRLIDAINSRSEIGVWSRVALYRFNYGIDVHASFEDNWSYGDFVSLFSSFSSS